MKLPEINPKTSFILSLILLATSIGLFYLPTEFSTPIFVMGVIGAVLSLSYMGLHLFYYKGIQ